MGDLQSKQPQGPPADQDLTGTTVGRFTIRARLGGGGMGEVYRADDTKLKRPVALKRVSPRLRTDDRYRQRLLKEAERASGLSYEHIAGIYDVLEENGEVFVVMEYVEGETLRQRLGRPLSLESFLDLAGQCAEALESAHKRGLAHRDIKPENIMITPEQQVKILDFGIAKRLPLPEEGTAETLDAEAPAGYASGTPGYIAPEALLQEDSDGRADIFSLGVVFYEALTGRHPFRADSPVATNDRILHATPLRVSMLNPKVSPELERIVTKMLAKHPEQRYATAADLVVDLRNEYDRVQRGLPPRPRPEPLPYPRRRQARWAAVAGIVVVLAAVLLIPPVREWLLCLVGMCPVPAQKSLVVLPCRAIGGEAIDQVYSDGLTETVTARLTQLTLAPDFQVAPASTVPPGTSVEEARTKLGANLVLQCSWQRFGDNVRINLVLVDTRTAKQLRTQTVTVAMADPLVLQDRVVLTAAGMLDLEVSSRAGDELTAHGTAAPTAYDFYLQGRGYLRNYDRLENIDSAIHLFHRALAIDPAYAQARAGLGSAYWQKYLHTKESKWVEAAQEACRQAVESNPDLADAHVCLGDLYNGTGQYGKAVTEFQRALEDEPTGDDAYRGLAAAYEGLGEMEEAERTYRRAIQARPHYWAGYNWLGVFYYSQGRYEEAATMFRRVVELAPDNARGYSNLGGIYFLMGRIDDAVEAFRRSSSIEPSGQTYSNIGTMEFFRGNYSESARAFEKATELLPGKYLYWGNLGDAYYWAPGERQKAAAAYRKAIELVEQELEVNPRNARALGDLAFYRAKLGQREEARAAIQQARQLASQDVTLLYRAAQVYVLLGESDHSLELLRQAVDSGFSPTQIQEDPELQALRKRPELQQLLNR